MANKRGVLINGARSLLDEEFNKQRGLNNGEGLLKIKIYKNTKGLVSGYKKSCYNCMTKYTLSFKYRHISPELEGVLNIQREFAREHLCEIAI